MSVSQKTQDRVWIGVDGNEGNVPQRVGSNVYAFELLRALARRVEQSSSRLAVRVFLSAPPLADWPAETENWKYTVTPPKPLWTITTLPRWIRKFPELSAFYSPGHYTPAHTSLPLISSVMDLGYEHFPEQFTTKDRWQLKLLTQWSVRRATRVVAISQATKQDLIKTYAVPADRVSVVYPGQMPMSKLAVSKAKELRLGLGLPEKYIVYVGTLQPRKNIVRLVEAFERLAAQDPDLHLVLVGRAGWLSQPILEKIEGNLFSARIVQLGFVTQEEKLAVLQGARVLALVGLLEGFGIPALEAIQVGVVPVVSNISSLPEVVGSEGELVDPFDVSDIARGIQDVLSWSQSRYAQEISEMQKHAEQFSWSDSAARLEKILLSVATQKST